MEDLRIQRKTDYKNVKKFFNILWKKRYIILIIAILLFILISPTETGTIIGKWITNFIGSIINNINI